MKKKKTLRIILFVIFAALLAVFLYTAYGRVGRNDKNSVIKGLREYSSDSNVIIVYFTGGENMPLDKVDAVSSASVFEENGEMTGNVGIAARKLQEITHGDLYSLQTKGMYSANYTYSTYQAMFEQILRHRPVLTDNIPDLSKYDTIILAYPQWWMKAPLAIESFVSQNDLSGKTIMPLSVHFSSGLGGSVEQISKLTDANITNGLAISESSVKSDSVYETLEKWLNQNNITTYTGGETK
ncbi:MAG: hypothetical protein IJ583_16560 [Firmicutes bacterium]|nr:hypothetical protein [Bacillota bacterium]